MMSELIERLFQLTEDEGTAQIHDVAIAIAAKVSQTEQMARLSASEHACYRWPEDTTEHRAMRAAFMDGAAHVAPLRS